MPEGTGSPRLLAGSNGRGRTGAAVAWGQRATQTFLGIYSNGNGILHGNVDRYHHVSKIRDVQGDHAYIYSPGEDEETVHACPGRDKRKEVQPVRGSEVSF